ncbi:head-tail joining protein [Robbsia andropogonis]|uniref:head-tail joining protein n=1 Tax=Robbsia andropogonis TaxID=28092 RepID=UPI003D1E24C5
MFDFDTLNASTNQAFGDSMSYTSLAGASPPDPVNGIWVDAFRKPYYKDDGSVGYTTTAPSVGIRVADLPSPPAKNDKIMRLKTSKSYVVFDVHLDGMGWVNLTLKETS